MGLQPRAFLFLVPLFFIVLYLLSRQANERPNFDQIELVPDSSSASNVSLRLTWENDSVPETRVLLHKVPGLTVLKNLYIYNGTIYIVTSEPDAIPEKRMMMSNGLPLSFEEENEPNDQTLSIITPREANVLFAQAASIMDGVSFIQTDAPQFLGHMYHFVVEIFALWHWRGYTSPELDPVFGSSRPYPRRYIFPYASRDQWQDHAGMNLWTIRAALGTISLEFKDTWAYWMNVGTPFVLEYVVLGDRAAWHLGPFWKSPKTEFPLSTRDHWWDPIRELVTTFAGPEQDTPSNMTQKPLITYISRQDTGRRLKEKDHRTLVAELQLLCRVIECDLEVAKMEELDRAEQIRLLSRTTILVSVYGTGLSGMLWLKPTPRTTVIEIFHPGGFLYDYEYISRSLGHKHYGIWNDKYFTAPDLPPPHAIEGFHGSNIPVNGTAVASLIHRRLTMASPWEA